MLLLLPRFSFCSSPSTIGGCRGSSETETPSDSIIPLSVTVVLGVAKGLGCVLRTASFLGNLTPSVVAMVVETDSGRPESSPSFRFFFFLLIFFLSLFLFFGSVGNGGGSGGATGPEAEAVCRDATFPPLFASFCAVCGGTGGGTGGGGGL